MKTRDANIAAGAIRGDVVSAIAASEGVSERQVFRILAKPEVRELVDRAARALTRTAALALQRGAASSATSLVTMATGAAPATAPRVAAARAVLELALRAVELDDVLRRLLELEQLIGERENRSSEGWPT